MYTSLLPQIPGQFRSIVLLSENECWEIIDRDSARTMQVAKYVQRFIPLLLANRSYRYGYMEGQMACRGGGGEGLFKLSFGSCCGFAHAICF